MTAIADMLYRMTTTQTLHAYFGYRDANAATDWLQRAFGFETTMSFPDENGGVAHSEHRLGDAVIIVFSDNDGYEPPPLRGETTGHGTYITVLAQEDVDRIYQNATDAGATGIWKPELSEWGNYRCRVLDLAGFEWTFGTHRPGEPVGDWS